jgi:biopolymer transport protein ExbD/biopolymer transport protein TolR
MATTYERHTTTGSPRAAVNVTPMIDVVLVLLMVFLLALGLRHAIPVQVPVAGTVQTPSPQITLQLLADGSYAVNGQPVPAERLGTLLTAVYADRPARLLFLRPDPGVPYGDVIRAASIARDAGVTTLALQGTPITD